MEFLSTFVQLLDATIRVRCRCCWPASPASIPSAPASSTSASKARCWPAPSPARRPPQSPARPGSGSPRRSCISVAAGAGPRLRLDHPSRQPDRLGRRDQLHRRRLDHHPRPGVVPPGRPHAGADRRRALRRDQSARRRRGARRAGPRPDLFRAALRPFAAGLRRLPDGAVHLVGAFRTRFGLRLRAVGENPAAVDTAGISVTWLRYRAVICTGVLTGIAGAYLSVAQNAGFVRT